MHMEIGRCYSRLISRLDRTVVLTDVDRTLLAELPLTLTNLTAGAAIPQTGEPRCVLVVNGFVCGKPPTLWHWWAWLTV